jgi:hypothetical protein
MTTLERIMYYVKTATTAHILLNPMQIAEVEVIVRRSLDDFCMEHGNYKLTLNRHYSEYPEILYSILWTHLRPIIYQWLTDIYPNAWFLLMYAEGEDQRRLTAPLKTA